jgi:hypothetical protein
MASEAALGAARLNWRSGGRARSALLRRGTSNLVVDGPGCALLEALQHDNSALWAGMRGTGCRWLAQLPGITPGRMRRESPR